MGMFIYYFVNYRYAVAANFSSVLQKLALSVQAVFILGLRTRCKFILDSYASFCSWKPYKNHINFRPPDRKVGFLLNRWNPYFLGNESELCKQLFDLRNYVFHR